MLGTWDAKMNKEVLGLNKGTPVQQRHIQGQLQ